LRRSPSERAERAALDQLRAGHRHPRPPAASLWRCARSSRRRDVAFSAGAPSEQTAALAELAAAYAFGLAKNHAFVDGNKRIAFMAMMTFLAKNDVSFAPDPAQATKIILSLAAGEVSEESLTRWIRDNWPSE
jgi:prophage maintenance system killer protein